MDAAQTNNAAAPSCAVCGAQALFMCSLCSNSPGGRCYCSANCQAADWPTHRRTCPGAARRVQEATAASGTNINEADASSQANLINGNVNTQNETDEEEDRVESIKFYLTQVYTILRPVMLCIMLSLLWVKLTNPPEPVYATGVPVSITPSVSVGTAFGSNGGGSDATSLVTALIILGQIIISTIIIAALFYYGQVKIIQGFFVFVITLLLGFFGFNLGAALLALASIPMDWITFSFFLWNLVLVGIAVIFYKAPLVIRQAYLILMSSMMAFSLSKLPDLVTWILLALLAAWDLVAVLCPYGPLRILLESSQRSGQEIPAALIYSAAVWVMAVGDSSAGPSSNNVPGSYNPISPAETVATKPTHAIYVTTQVAQQQVNPVSAASHLSTSHAEVHTPREVPSHIELQSLDDPARLATLSMAPESPQGIQNVSNVHASGGNESIPNLNNPTQVEEEEEDEERGVQLGLGDFVFYSVLVGRASLFDWITTVSTTIAVTTGLTATIFILALLRRPLPALPISIAFGILFYLISSVMLTVQVYALIQRPALPTININDPSGLWVGKGSGGGMVYA